MAIFKCKMCGGTLNVNEGVNVCECEYCGTVQTLPNLDNEKRNQLFDRANYYRIQNEFDKASVVYENILSEAPDEAEAHWGMCLCRYGIEYVVDPKTKKRIPTCHRTQFKSIFEDPDYLAALKNSDSIAQNIYKSEAEYIDKVQKSILEISAKEEPFDIFICYKESDNAGNRTTDSVIAQDIYTELTEKGYKVFFARITLEDKLGSAYEPYIFAALNSARIMLIVGTKPEHFNAVWVKNEWSRYLAMIESSQKKHIIPCYRDMSPYDMPEEFIPLQSQDVAKVGYMQDLLRGIEKILGKGVATTVVKETVVTSGNLNTTPLLKRAFLFLEDGDWRSADDYCEKVLDLDPECAQAYLGKLLAELEINKAEGLLNANEDFSDRDNYQKAYRFGDEDFKKQLEKYKKSAIYKDALIQLYAAKSASDFYAARAVFMKLGDFIDSEQRAQECNEHLYQQALNTMRKGARSCFAGSERAPAFCAARDIFLNLGDFADSKQKAEECENSALDALYGLALNTMRQARSSSDYQSAAKQFDKISGFVDSAKLAEKCRMISNQSREIKNSINNAVQKRGETAKQIESLKTQKKILGLFQKKEKLRLQSEINKLSIELYGLNTKIDSLGQEYNAVLGIKFDGSYLKCYNFQSSISAGGFHTIALKSNGTVVAVGRTTERDVYDWKDIIAFSAGFQHTVGLKSNGTVVAVGYNKGEPCNVSGWKDIVSVSAGSSHTVGLKQNGIVVAVGENDYGQCNVSDWTDIVSVSAGYHHTVGLKSYGTVVAVGFNFGKVCDVSDWKDIIAVSAGQFHTVGLKQNGTVVAVGDNSHGQCNVSDWKDIVAVSAGSSHTVGLKSNGTVVAVGKNDYRQRNVSSWKDIVAVSAGGSHTVGLKSNGTVVAVGDNREWQCNVSRWSGIKTTNK